VQKQETNFTQKRRDATWRDVTWRRSFVNDPGGARCRSSIKSCLLPALLAASYSDLSCRLLLPRSEIILKSGQWVSRKKARGPLFPAHWKFTTNQTQINSKEVILHFRLQVAELDMNKQNPLTNKIYPNVS